ncbi:hypothetical protein Drose_15765 [Dactylosporangium roseum]|uniref:Anti-sigma-K factor RskA N-terminal domain-containing protein n=1 Tax=Dactylosporangium roseum TaxID=47989 RepID=A0ABY5ZDA4_9ACTN|nr:hypothetical protein [Dactylosporangium roseum]UWZ39556.1 hypothetical protein Drose_15765 [Dactylosporangium roseum]
MTDIHALAGAYALDAVDKVEWAAFTRHLAQSDVCRLETGELRTSGRPAPRPSTADASCWRTGSSARLIWGP